MTSAAPALPNADAHKYGVLFVFAAGVLWSTVGLGIRLIEEAVVWQILLYRSLAMSAFLYVLIRVRSGESPFAQVRRIGAPAIVAGLALVAAYSGGIYAIQTTSVANAMLLFATAPFMAAVLGWIVLREPVRGATWVAIAAAIGGIGIMVADKSGSVALMGSLAALGSAFGFAVFTVALRWGRTGEMLPAVFFVGSLCDRDHAGHLLWPGAFAGPEPEGRRHLHGHGGVPGWRRAYSLYAGVAQPSGG
jgi:drug/metabolite transporter (DMT)-like permease